MIRSEAAGTFKSWIVKYPPDTVFLMTLCVLSGISQLVVPQNVLTHMPMWVFLGWSVLLTAGAATSLVGIFWKNLPIGFLIEGAGRSMLWPASIAYSLTLIKYDAAYYEATLVLAFGIVCYVRSVYVRFVYKEWLGMMESRANESD